MKYVIIGAGIAGVEAALEIRKRDTEGPITIIDFDNEARGRGCIYRPALKEFLSGALSDIELSVYPEGYLSERKIAFIHAGVSSIDPAGRTVRYITSDSPNVTQTMPFDRLLIATGAVPRTPDLFHHDPAPENQFYFKFRDDAVRIRHWLSDHTGTCCVVGGGILGIETAELLRAMDREVILLSRSDIRLFKGIPEKLKNKLDELFRRKGVRTLRFDDVLEIPFLDGRFTHLNLTDRTVIPIDAIILCAGVDVVRMLPDSAALAFSRGIHVDRHMRTSDPNIFAAGDCVFMPRATTVHPVGADQGHSPSPETLRLWEPSRRMGRVAGANMTAIADMTDIANMTAIVDNGRGGVGGEIGDDIFYPWPMYFHTHLFGTPLGFFGSFDAPKEGHERIVRETDDSYREFVLSKEDGRIVGASFLGGRPFPPPLLRLMERMRDGEHIDLDPASLLDDSFDQESLWYL